MRRQLPAVWQGRPASGGRTGPQTLALEGDPLCLIGRDLLLGLKAYRRDPILLKTFSSSEEQTGLAEDEHCVTLHEDRRMCAQVADSFGGQPVVQVQCGSV
jgi:hypothetical protein